MSASQLDESINQAVSSHGAPRLTTGGEATELDTMSDRRVARTIVAHVGLALVAVGCFLPWVRIGGLNRTGAGLANLSLSLADLGFSTPLSVVGYAWYSIPLLAVLTWLTLWRSFPPQPDRATSVVAVILAVMAGLFWALVGLGPFSGPHIGAMAAFLGALIVVVGCRYPRPGRAPAGVQHVL